jgi:hypothetical protein
VKKSCQQDQSKDSLIIFAILDIIDKVMMINEVFINNHSLLPFLSPINYCGLRIAISAILVF